MDCNDDDLVLLGKIRPGETINLVTKEIVIHRSWYASMTRWWNEEVRDDIPEWVEKTIKNEIFNLTRMIRQDLIATQHNKILAAISGMRNLCLTYLGDPVATKLSLIIRDAEISLWKIEHPTGWQRNHSNRINIPSHSYPNLELPFPSTY